ncbi:MAG TPA: heme exporter protein CcmB [Longilinea sp.]|nr:heme exporter protein CcmB [Longilinea sp.]
MRTFTRTLLAVAWKDLAAEWRSREILSATLVFSILVIFIYNFALDLEVTLQSDLAAGILWVTFVFAGTLGLNRSMSMEKDRGGLDGLLLAPVDRSAIFFGKMTANLVIMLVVAIVVVPVFSLLYTINLILPGVILVILLGSVGYTAVGTLLAAMAVQARTRDMLLPILLFPVALPLLVAAVKATAAFLSPSVTNSAVPWLNLLIAYDVIFLVIAWLVFDFVVEE